MIIPGEATQRGVFGESGPDIGSSVFVSGLQTPFFGILERQCAAVNTIRGLTRAPEHPLWKFSAQGISATMRGSPVASVPPMIALAGAIELITSENARRNERFI
jgi:hypothetical protein